jgi:spore coat protein U-like protein
MIKTMQCLLLLAACAVFEGSASAVVVCSVSSTGAAFGAYDPLNASVKDTVGTIFVTCTGSIGAPVNYSIALSVHGSGHSPRTMRAGGARLNYNLFTDGSHSSIWGDGKGGTATVSDSYTMSGSSTTRNYTVYGEIPAQGGATVGSYMDTVVITVTY